MIGGTGALGAGCVAPGLVLTIGGLGSNAKMGLKGGWDPPSELGREVAAARGRLGGVLATPRTAVLHLPHVTCDMYMMFSTKKPSTH